MSGKNLKGRALLEKEIELVDYQGVDRIVPSTELAEELSKIEESAFVTATGVKSLDRILGNGVEAGELIIVTGPTGEGKTTLLMTITKNMAETDINSTWFTLEVTPRQFMQKLTKMSDDKHPKLPLFYVPRAAFEEAEEAYVKVWERKHGRKYEMIDWIEDRIIESKVKVERDGKLMKIVFIDHIHQIFEEAKTQNVSLEIGNMVARIKHIATTHNLAIFLIAHTKDPEGGSTREPKKEDIRDSGLISRLADTIIGVWRISNSNDGTQMVRNVIEEDDNKAKVRVFKNRRSGKQGSFVMYHANHYLTEDAFNNTEFSDEKF